MELFAVIREKRGQQNKVDKAQGDKRKTKILSPKITASKNMKWKRHCRA